MMSCQSLTTASGSAAKALRRLMPALLTRMETWPTSAPIFFATARQSSRSVTSSVKLSALPPAAMILAVSAARLAVDVERDDLRALSGIAERDCVADAGASAGDHRDASLQKCAHCFPPFRPSATGRLPPKEPSA